MYRCRLPGLGLDAAVKVVPAAGDAEAAAAFELEVKALAAHPHPNFVQLLGASIDGPQLCLITQLMPGGSARASIAPGATPASWRQRLTVAVGAARGMAYLHNQVGKVHRDIKPSNILLDGHGHRAVLCDFGLVREARTDTGKTDRTSKPLGTAAFMSHEALKGKITPAMDVYALGVTLLELITGRPAEGGGGGGDDGDNLVIAMEEAIEAFEDGDPAAALAFCDPRLPAPAPSAATLEAVLAIAVECMDPKYKKRPTAEALLGRLEPLLAAADAAEGSVATDLMSLVGLSSARQCWASVGRRGLDACKLFPVAPGSHEHGVIAAAFNRTLAAATIDRVDRVENGYMHEAFSLQAATLEKQIGADYVAGRMRRLLFHGTQAVDAIVNSTDGHGFLPLLAGTAVGAIYGDGTYFARDAKYSDGGYARTLPSGQKQMLVVDVLVGRAARGTQGDKMCPLLPGERYTKYNSLVDNVAAPAIFVVQHSNQAYPAYLITYHR